MPCAHGSNAAKTDPISVEVNELVSGEHTEFIAPDRLLAAGHGDWVNIERRPESLMAACSFIRY